MVVELIKELVTAYSASDAPTKVKENDIFA